MKTLVAILVIAMIACAFAQVVPQYSYGYNTYTPGARVSHHASGYAAPHGSAYYGSAYYGGAYPYRVY